MATKRNLAAEAEKLISQGRLEAAAQKYELLIKENPRDLNTINKVGDIYARVGKKKEAITHFRSLCAAYEKDGFLPKAIAIYKKIIKLDPRDLEACRQLAGIQARQGHVNEARANFTTLLSILESAGEVEEMIAVRRSLVDLEPENVDQHIALAELLATVEGRGTEAADVYADAGAELDRQGRHEEARSAYMKAGRFKPGSPDLAARLATSHVAAGDIDTGISLLRGTLESTGEDPDLLVLLADFHVQAGQKKDAVEVLRRAVARSPERMDLRIRFGRLLMGLGDRAGAFTAMQPGLAGIDGDSDLRQAIGVLEEMISTEGFPPQAGDALLDLFDRLRDRNMVLIRGRNLVAAMKERGDLAGARRLARRLVGLRPGESSLTSEFGDLLEEKEQEAQVVVEPSLDMDQAPRAAGGDEGDPLILHAEGDGPSGLDPGVATTLGLPEVPDLSREDNDFISEHMTEADVFVKYGLPDRAVEQLQVIVAKFPGYLPALVRLKELHLEEGQREETRRAMSLLVKAHLAAGDRASAEEQLAEFRRFDPTSRELGELVVALEPQVADPEPASRAEGDVFEIQFDEDSRDRDEAAQEEDAVQVAQAGGAKESAGTFAAEAPSTEASGEGLLDFASEIDAVLGSVGAEEQAGAEQEPESLADMISAFRENVEKEVSEDDFETHYNLGIAFKEMGLTDEAIGEFQIAAKASHAHANSCSMLGLCFREKGLPDQAVKWYRRGIEAGSDKEDEEILGLRYDLADLLVEMGELEQARALFSDVFGTDSQFREVRSRLKEVEKALSEG